MANYKLKSIFVLLYSIYSVNTFALVKGYCDENASYPYGHLCRASPSNEFVASTEICGQRELNCRKGAGGITRTGQVVINEWFLVEGDSLLYPSRYESNILRDCIDRIVSQSPSEEQRESDRCRDYAEGSASFVKLRVQCLFNPSNPDAAACDY